MKKLYCLLFILFYSCAPKVDPGVKNFIEAHWKRPPAPMGEKPKEISPEISLDPKTCAGCHEEQYEGWRQSFHAKSVGPGLLGQLVQYDLENPSSLDACLRCHAPLNEQKKDIQEALQKNPPYRMAGLNCQSCHVRDWKWYGPVRLSGGQKKDAHGGFQETPAFSDSSFCAACHQFPEGWRELNGKLLENTYNEWKESVYGKNGVQCQDCHMPGRQHLWKGIHDPEMTQGAVDIQLGRFEENASELSALLQIENTGAGHYFPTYVTPRVFVFAAQFDEKGNEIEQTREVLEIGRITDMALKREIKDTRIAPGGKASLSYRKEKATGSFFLTFWVVVEPDYFYENFYKDWLSRGRGDRLMLERALREAQKNKYEIYRKEIRLKN